MKTNDERRETDRESLSMWFRSWRYFFWILALILLVVFFYAEENFRGRWSWNHYQRELKARGEPVDGSAFVPPPVADSENFAMTPLLAPLFEFIPGTQHWRDTNALTRAQSVVTNYNAAASSLQSHARARSNSWVGPRTDLIAWQRALAGARDRNKARTQSEGPIADGSTSPRRSAVEENGTTSQAGGTNLTFQEAATRLLAELSESDSAIQQLRADSRRSYSRFNIRYNEENPAGILLPHLAVLNHFSHILQLRSSAELALGQTLEAFDDVYLMLYLAEANRTEPFLISQLVRLSELQLALQPIAEGMRAWSEPQLRTLQERLGRFDFCADVQRALQAERVFFAGGVIEFLRRSPGKFDALTGPGAENDLPAMLWTIAPGGWFDFEKLAYNRLFEQYITPGIDLARRQISPARAHQADNDITTLLTKPASALFFHHRWFSRILIPSVSRAFRRTALVQTGVDLAVTACALERYRRVHGGFPETLDALIPQFLSKLPTDIINGQPLHYKRTEDGQYLLYSIGWNETDDGGEVPPRKGNPGQLEENGDWVWRPELKPPEPK